jgi:activating signal cointegrator 1
VREIPVLTLWQPWASLCVIINPATGLPYKTIETRGWSTKYRGPLAIHAASRPPCSYRTDTWVGNWKAHRRTGDGGYDLSLYQARSPELSPEPSRGLLDLHELPVGAIVATCTLVDVVPTLGMDRPTPLSGGWVRIGDTVLGLNRGGPDDHLEFIDDQRPYGDFRSGRYAWLLSDVVAVDPPVPFKGGQGLTKTWEPVAA